MQVTVKTLTFKIEEVDFKTPTIKDSILERIETFKQCQEIAKAQIKDRVKVLKAIRAASLKYLNESVGEDVWSEDSMDADRYYSSIKHSGQESIGVKIGFRDGRDKNTCYNDWDLWFQTPKQPKQTLGELSYAKLDLEKIEMWLCGHSQNKGKIHKINNISEISKYLEVDYLTYFTHKK